MNAYDERQKQYAADMARHEAWFRPRLEDAYDHRHDSVAAESRFKNELGIYATLFANGSKCTVLAALRQAERRVRGGM